MRRRWIISGLVVVLLGTGALVGSWMHRRDYS